MTDKTFITAPLDRPYVRLVAALFNSEDVILVRAMESFGKGSQQKPPFPKTEHFRAVPALAALRIGKLIEKSEHDFTNLYFGVCPRVGDKGQFDLAWQIRTVRCLWADVDDVTVEKALAQVQSAGIPQPSIVVNSGNGAHFYWLLDQPYLIDDVGPPAAVLMEWGGEKGRNAPRKYFVQDDERIYLDDKHRAPPLSPKARRFQSMLTGISQRIGGDHTTDLPRLLRIPGTMNRKDQRNGREPVPCTLVECDGGRRYSIETFAGLAVETEEAKRAGQIAKLPLPQIRKLSTQNGDKLGRLLADCAAAPAGCRSEADFALCCFAVRKGIDSEEVWNRASGLGKFAERGREYFDRTWAAAEDEVRTTMFEEAAQPRKSPVSPASADTGTAAAVTCDRPIIQIDPALTPVCQTLGQVTDCLAATGVCFSRSGQLVVIRSKQVNTILSPSELAGLLNEHTEFYLVGDKGGEFKPLPPAYANTWLNKHAESARLFPIKLFTHNPVYTEDVRLVTTGYDAASGIYYAGPPITPRDGTEHLDALLRDFCFQTPGDRTNYLGVLLTAVLIPRFIGSKPALLLNGNQPGLGKSILAQIIAILRDGRAAETVSYNPNDEEFEKRLGAVVRSGATTIIVDNAKSRGRNPKIESACLERSITDPVLSYRLLGQSASIQAENSHLFCITANTPEVSHDLVTRSVIVNLYHEGDPQRRQFSIADPEAFAQAHRKEILGELLEMIERWKAAGMPQAKVASRFNKRGWGNIVGGILEVCGEPDFAANAEEAAVALDESHREFAELVSLLADHSQGTWTAGELAKLCGRSGLLRGELGDGTERSQATKLGTLAGRFVGVQFKLYDGRIAVFQRHDGRDGKLYRVGLADEVRNLAEPLRNLGSGQVPHLNSVYVGDLP